MKNIWTVLQIQQTHDTKTIRQAYAKQLKETNPEIDPDGFKELRAAYEKALNHAATNNRPPSPFLSSTAIQHSSQHIPNPPIADEVIEAETPQPQMISGIPKARKAIEKTPPQPRIINGIPKTSKIEDSLSKHTEEVTQVVQMIQTLFASENEFAMANLLLRWNHEGIFNHFAVSAQFQEGLLDYFFLQNICLKKLFLTAYELFSWDQLLLKTNNPLGKKLTSMIERDDLRHLFFLYKKLRGFPFLLAAALNDFETASALLNNNPNIIHDKDADGNTALHIACIVYAAEFATFLITHRIDINAKNLSGKTALILAVEQKNLELVQTLCNAGADINSCDLHHNTVLHYAVSSRYIEMVQYLASLPQIKLDPEALYIAVRTNHLNMVKTMVDIGWDVTAESPRIKESPLVCAARNDFLQMLILLLNAGADPNQPDRNDNVPLIIAAERGFTQAVTLLLQKEAEQTHIILAAHQALKSNYFHIVQMLAGTNDLSTVDKIRTFASINGQAHAYGYTSWMDDFLLKPEMITYTPLALETLSPLFQALYCQDANLFRDLLSKGAIPHQPLPNGLDLLHVAIQLHRHEQFDALLQHHADINQRVAPYYFSPLFVAVKVQNQYAYRKLIELGAQDLPTATHHTALFVAVYNNDLAIMQELIARGSDIYQYAADGYRTLVFAAARMKSIEALQLLLSLDLDPDMIAGDSTTQRCCFPAPGDEIPDTPLTAAVKNRDLIGMKLLLEAGADPNRKSNGKPPLHLTLANGYYPVSETVNYYAVIDESHAIIDLLLKYGADINLKSDEGHTFLIKAIQSGPAETAIHLIESGADVFLPDSNGKLPIDYARENKSSLLVSILEQGKERLC